MSFCRLAQHVLVCYKSLSTTYVAFYQTTSKFAGIELSSTINEVDLFARLNSHLAPSKAGVFQCYPLDVSWEK